MIRIFGDVHTKFWHFKTKLEQTPDDYDVIQVGDFGYWPKIIENYANNNSWLHRSVYFIDGNHEHFDLLYQTGEGVREVYTNLVYIPRGTIMEMDGRTILFLGGAESVDRHVRIPGLSWFPQESITQLDVMEIDYSRNIDLMITHVPPMSVVEQITTNIFPEWNVSAVAVQNVWDEFDNPPLYCGHFHMDRKVGNVQILNELSYVDI